MATPTNRLGRAAWERRRALGMHSRQALAKAAGVSERTVDSVEREGYMPSGQVQASIEQALRWPIGTMQQILAGHEPPNTMPTTQDLATEAVGVARELRAALDHLDRVRADVERLLDRLPSDG